MREGERDGLRQEVGASENQDVIMDLQRAKYCFYYKAKQMRLGPATHIKV